MTQTSVQFVTNGKPWASGETRGRQMAQMLGADIDQKEPLDLSAVRVIFFVKCVPTEDFLKQLVAHHVHMFFDVVDTDGYLDRIASLDPALSTVIAISHTAEDYLRARLSVPVVYLPEHHCNFENFEAHVPVDASVSYCGYRANMELDEVELGKKLTYSGLMWIPFFMDESKSYTREDIVRYYKDGFSAQLTWRTPRLGMPPELKNPLKILNAASFGIPTVCYPEISSVREFPYFVSACSPDELVKSLWLAIHTADRDMLVEKAKTFHISRIADLYRQAIGERTGLWLS